MAEFFATGAGAAVAVLLIVLAVLWLVLPFAVFGVKGLLRDNLDAQEAILNELREMNGKEAVDESKYGRGDSPLGKALDAAEDGP